MSEHAHAPAHAAHEPHVLPLRTYYTIFGALMGLMVLTVGAALFDLGVANFAVAMGIAVVKMILILLFFMHVKYSEKLVWIFSTAAFFWLLLLVIGTLNDYFTRGEIHVWGK